MHFPASPLDRISNLQPVPAEVAQRLLDRLATRIPGVVAKLRADDQLAHTMRHVRLY